MSARLRLGAWIALVAVVLRVLEATSVGPGDGDGHWTVALVGGVRVAALAMGWYLVAVGAARLAARASPRWVGALVERLTLPAVRRMLDGVAGLSLAVSLAGSPSPAAATDHEPPVLRHSDETDLPDDAEPTLMPPMTTAQMEPAAPTPAAPSLVTWTVQPGEHFWSIAEKVLGVRLGRSPSDAEVAPYWTRFVDANRSVLVDRDNADLLYPAQVLRLPDA